MKKKLVKGGLLLVSLFVLLHVVAGCFTFRLSKTEIKTHFENRIPKTVFRELDIEGRTVAYLEAQTKGEANLVFLHGAPGSSSAWIDFFSYPQLSRKFNLVSIDRPGYGHSNFGRAVPDLQEQAYLIQQVCLQLDQSVPTYIIGHSLGGPVAARMAMDFPDKVQGLVLVAASIAPELEPEEWFRGPLNNSFLRWTLPRSLRVTNEEIYFLKEELNLMLPLWRQILCPVALVHGESDSLVPFENVAFAQEKLGQVTISPYPLPEVDHFIPWSHPDTIISAILQLHANQQKLFSDLPTTAQ